MDNKHIILDLCSGTGAWGKPYADNGYDVRNITLPEYDVRTYDPPKNVYGILAAPPCTEFAVSGARWWKDKDHKDQQLLKDALKIVYACLNIIKWTNPVFWALENPVGRLRKFIGPYKYTFQPYEYGDPWTKRTCIWGRHIVPIKNPVESVGQWTGRADQKGIVDHLEYLLPDWVYKLPPRPNRAKLRSVTPPGFAKAFFEANR